VTAVDWQAHAVAYMVERDEALAERDAALDELERLRDLVRRLRAWDQLPYTGDGPYWMREIDAALDSPFTVNRETDAIHRGGEVARLREALEKAASVGCEFGPTCLDDGRPFVKPCAACIARAALEEAA
jgi:hypothetical protein